MIHVENLTRRFGTFTAVDSISFRLERGEVVGLLGANGAGKTTTMRMLTGFLPASQGRMEVAGFDVLRQSLEVRRRIGYLPEAVPLYDEHRVEEMLDFQGRLHGLPRKERKRRVGEALDWVLMSEHRRSVVGTLSKGQRQRIGLAVALLPDPEVLILDEPTSGLDPLQRIEVRKLVGELARERTVLLSSHILPEVEAICPRTVILHRGRVVADGTRDELVARLGSTSFVRVVLRAQTPPVDGDDRVRAALVALPGAGVVEERESDAGWRTFEIPGPDGLRDAIGALALREGWPLRELFREEPTLERLFSRIALDIDPALTAPPEQGDPALTAPAEEGAQ